MYAFNFPGSYGYYPPGMPYYGGGGAHQGRDMLGHILGGALGAHVANKTNQDPTATAMFTIGGGILGEELLGGPRGGFPGGGFPGYAPIPMPYGPAPYPDRGSQIIGQIAGGALGAHLANKSNQDPTATALFTIGGSILGEELLGGGGFF